MRGLTSSVLFALALSLGACGDSKNKSAEAAVKGTLDGLGYVVNEGTGLQRTDSDLKGSGVVLFKNPLKEVGSKDDFALTFTLEDGGSLELLTHTDKAGANGVSVIFTRSGSSLSLAYAAGGATSEKKALEGIDATGEISLAVDIHNDETPSHNLVWNGRSDSFSEDSALSNSEKDIASPRKRSLLGSVACKSHRARRDPPNT